MPKVLIEGYSTFYDLRERVTFEPVLDRRTLCRVGVAEVSAEQAERYAGRSGFQVLSEEEWADMNRIQEPVRAPAPETGDPLRDASVLGGSLQGPPPPPESK